MASSNPKAPPSNYKKMGVDIFAGFCSGIGVTLVGHPFETLKVRLQTQPTGADKIYNGLVDCVQKTWKWEGVRGFYRGVASPLCGQLFFRSAMFFVYGEFQRRWSQNGKYTLRTVDYMLGGTITWGVSSLIESPLQLASSQMQVDIVRRKANPEYVAKYNGVFDFVAKTVRERGLFGLYQGYAPALIRNSIGGTLHFGTYETIRRKIARDRGVPVEQVGFWVNMLAGGMGGVVFWTSIYPIDVVKSALQTQPTDPSQRKYKGMIDCFQKLWAERGAKRFSVGFSACLLRALPANAVLLTIASMVKEYGYAYIS